MKKWGLIALVALLVVAFGMKLRLSPREPELFHHDRLLTLARGNDPYAAAKAIWVLEGIDPEAAKRAGGALPLAPASH